MKMKNVGMFAVAALAVTNVQAQMTEEEMKIKMARPRRIRWLR